MRAVVQRVSSASVTIDGSQVAAIGPGLCLLVGVAEGDVEVDAIAMADKVAALRIFPDSEGKMNLSVSEVGGSVLVVSQFTLLGDARRGRRPSFANAAIPERAEPLVELVERRLEELGIEVARGVFGARMEVALVNNGPVTLVIEVRGGVVV